MRGSDYQPQPQAWEGRGLPQCSLPWGHGHGCFWHLEGALGESTPMPCLGTWWCHHVQGPTATAAGGGGRGYFGASILLSIFNDHSLLWQLPFSLTRRRQWLRKAMGKCKAEGEAAVPRLHSTVHTSCPWEAAARAKLSEVLQIDFILMETVL